MQLLQDISLKPYNTFGIDTTAEYFAELDDEGLLPSITSDVLLPEQKHILGGGSNILLTKPVKGLVLLNKTKGITVEKEGEEHIWLNVSSGEVWHEFVLYAINKNWGGIENLALIPGTVGAAPMQNIGAYGVEAKETIESVTCWHWEEEVFMTFRNEDCVFGYRDSIFKHQLKEKVFITSVTFRLNKKHTFNTKYGAIEQELEKMGITQPSIKAIADAVIAIRSNKLPDPKQIGNSGSFFKNPVIEKVLYDEIRTTYADMPSFPAGASHIKVPAAWLIEQCNWKGYRKGDAGVHVKQPLVLVNYGNTNGNEVWQLSEEILQSVKKKFGIVLEREVQVW
jgi:UDP-N-acetylmuramate dehydrogenase